MFIAITMNHLRAIKAWTDAHQGHASLDLSNFVLEVKARNRYYRLFPQFLAEANGRMSHVTALGPDTTAFIGWRPYHPLQYSLSSDKLKFKQALAQAGLATPAHWPSAEEATDDFILKRSVGSFGYQLAGPFRKGQVPQGTLPTALTDAKAPGSLYAEAFVPGQNIKAWFWDGRPVHTQCQSYARIRGDGRQTARFLVAQRLEDIGKDWRSYKESDAITACLAYQGVPLDAPLAQGEEAWLDYRYGRHFSQEKTTESEDNAWLRLADEQRAQISQAGAWLTTVIKQELKAPVLSSMDGVLDDTGKIWWLELNSNPICPPTAYFAMLSSLFGTPAEAPANAFSRVVNAPRRAARREGSSADSQGGGVSPATVSLAALSS